MSFKEKRKWKFNDAPVKLDVRASILQLRSIYNNLSDKEFAAWYAKRYGVKASAVQAFLEEVRRNEQTGDMEIPLAADGK